MHVISTNAILPITIILKFYLLYPKNKIAESHSISKNIIIDAKLNEPTLKNNAMQYRDGANSRSIRFSAVFIPSNNFDESICINHI